MLPGGLFVSRPDFSRRVAVKQRAHDSLNCLPLLAYLVFRHDGAAMRTQECASRH